MTAKARGGVGVAAALAVAALMTLPGASVAASTAADPDLQAGFPAKVFVAAGTYHGGPGIHVLVGNVDDDPTPEIFASGLSAGPLWAWNADGSPVDGWPTRDEGGSVYPALGNLSERSPGFEVVTGTWGQGPTDSRVHAHLGDGSDLAGWPQHAVNYIDNPPMLADIDGDGIDEIFANEEDHTIDGYRADGSPLPGWGRVAGTPWAWQRLSTPAAGDLDGDGSLEVVTASGEWVVAFHGDGSFVTGFPFAVPAGQSVDVYPVIGDVDGDGALEIVLVESGIVYVIGPDGTVERTMRTAGSIAYGTAPALADLDGDGVPEIVVLSDGALDVWHGDGTTPAGWPVMWGSYWIGNGAPVVGDVNGDNAPDIVVTDMVAGANAGELRAYNADGTLLAGFPKSPSAGSNISAPAIADIDLDGRNEIIVAGSDSRYVGYFDALWAYDLGGGPHGRIEWGQFMGDPRHQGRYGAATAPPPAADPQGSSVGPARLVADIAPGPQSSGPSEPAALGSALLFRARDAAGAELWRSDGTAAGTTRLSDIRSGAAGSNPRELTRVGSTVFFVADDGSSGAELWKTDGTAAGTQLVRDIWPGAPGSQPHELVAVGGTLFFAAWDGAHGFELWRSDGTAAGTALVRDIVPPGAIPDGAGSGSDPRSLTNVNGTLFFTAFWIDSTVQTSGIGLSRSDGTAAGTRMLGSEYVGGGSQQWYPFDLEPVSGLVYFTDGDRLGSSDGTDPGTRFFQDIYYGGDSLLEGLTNVDGSLYFRALEGGLGQELWRSTGGPAAMVRNIAPEYRGANPSEITPLGPAALFRGSDATTGFELWRSDGTEAGTQLVADIHSGAASSFPSALTAAGTSLYFAADDGAHGFELWRSDGSAAGTELVHDVAPGPRGSAILWTARAGATLFFSADDGTHGQELWALDLESGGGGGDVTPPSVTLTAPLGGETVRGPLSFAADATDDTGVTRVEFLVDGVTIGSDSTAPYGLDWSSASGSDGVKSLAARAVDGAGNEATSPPRTVTVDNTAPETTISSGPSGLTTSQSAAFAFSASEPGATFECALDGAAYSPCSSQVSYAALGDGQHTFQVRAADGLGNVDQTPATRSWTVDATPPETTIDFGPSGTVSSRSATFSFSANEAASFRCSLDGAAASPCSSPVGYSHLRRGTHTFTVHATDQAGNVDPTPASRTWTAR